MYNNLKNDVNIYKLINSISDYHYYENVGSCYKIPLIAYSWNQAYDECYNEGSHLVILNSELEHQVVQNLTKEAPKITGVHTTWSFFAGIRAAIPKDGGPVVYKTVLSKCSFNFNINSIVVLLLIYCIIKTFN